MRAIFSIIAVIAVFCSVIKASPSPYLNDVTYSGNYMIIACGDQAPAVKALLDLTYKLLVQAMDLLPSPVGNGGGSTVYNAFFNGVDPAAVKAVYQLMTAGVNYTINGRTLNPTIVCVNDQDPGDMMRKAWHACLPTPGGQNMGLWGVGTPIVFFCPIWTKLQPFPLPYMCGTVGRKNVLTSPINMATTQYTNLVHELAHMYLENDLSPEVLLPNDCIALPPDQSANNPQNYAFYAGCRYSDPCHVANQANLSNADLKAGCHQYPTRPSTHSRPQRPQVELLEVDGINFNVSEDITVSPECATVPTNATVETLLEVC